LRKNLYFCLCKLKTKLKPMRLEQYDMKTNKTHTMFDFISEGQKGSVLKSVRYTKIKVKGVKNLYNLGFGDVNKETSDIDDLVVKDNQDPEKVLATVAKTIIFFINRYPNAVVFFRGSTEVRTRLYQMAIGKYIEELSDNFDLLGLTEKGWLPFEKNTTYIAFLINRKKN
jgi:hypothetical protein